MDRDQSRVNDVLDAAAKIKRHLPSFRASLECDAVLQAAIVRWLTIVGEAVGKLPGVPGPHPEVPWHAVVGMRHRLVHNYAYAYVDLDLELVWAAITRDVPDLAALIRDEGTI